MLVHVDKRFICQNTGYKTAFTKAACFLLLPALSEKNKIRTYEKSPHHLMWAFKYGALGRIRTSDRLVRSQVLYPAELRARNLLRGYFYTT